MTKEMYATPEMDVVEFGQEDIVCTVSGIGGDTGNGDGFEGNGGED